MKVPSFAFKKKSDDEVPILPRTEDDLKKMSKEETVASEKELEYQSKFEESLKGLHPDPKMCRKVAISLAKIKKMEDEEKKVKDTWDLFSCIFLAFALLFSGFMLGRSFSKPGFSMHYQRPYLNYSNVPKTMSLEAYAAADIYLRKNSGAWWTLDEYRGYRTALGMISELWRQKVIACDWNLEDDIGFFNEIVGAEDDSTTEEKQKTAMAKNDEEMPVDDAAGGAEENKETVKEEVDKEEYDEEETYDNFYNDEIEVPA